MRRRKCSTCGARHSSPQATCASCQRDAARSRVLKHVGLISEEEPERLKEELRQPILNARSVPRWSGGYIFFGEEQKDEKPARVDDPLDADRAPDLIENVLAWRGWDVTPTGHLTASAVQGVWDPGANKAVCRHAGHTEDVPAVGCGCGFYGWHEPADIQHGNVRGAIKCWGEVIVHDVGLRAEYAEIQCLFRAGAPEIFLERAAERYGVPLVETQAEAEELVDGIRIPKSMRPESVPAWREFTVQLGGHITFGGGR